MKKKYKGVWIKSYYNDSRNHIIKVLEELSELETEICHILVNRKIFGNDEFLKELSDADMRIKSIKCILSNVNKRKIELRQECKIKSIKIKQKDGSFNKRK